MKNPLALLLFVAAFWQHQALAGTKVPEDVATWPAHEQVMEYVRAEDFATAAEIAERVVDTIENQKDAPGGGVPAGQLAAYYYNLGYIYARLDNFARAETNLDRAIRVRETLYGPNSPQLIDSLRLLAHVYTKMGRNERALQILRHSQHITHRQDGVFTLDQLPIVDRIVWLEVNDGDLRGADRQQRFYYRINEQNYGGMDPRMLPAMSRLGAWFRQTGQFADAAEVYRKAITVTEATHGHNDLSLIGLLRDWSSVLYIESKCCPEEPMDRVLEILAANPQADVADSFDAMVFIADMQTIMRESDKADRFYRRVWELLKPGQAREVFKEPRFLGIGRGDRVLVAYRRAAEGIPGYVHGLTGRKTSVQVDGAEPEGYEVIGDPLPVCYPMVLDLMSRAEQKALETFYVSFEFDVASNGRVADVEVVDANAPSRLKDYAKQLLHQTQYRPRMDDGVPVLTENVTLRQTFGAANRSSRGDELRDFTRLATHQGCQLLARVD